MTTININENKVVVQKETEKAFLLPFTGALFGDVKYFDVWVPKSILKENKLPNWFNEKVRSEKKMEYVVPVYVQKGY